MTTTSFTLDDDQYDTLTGLLFMISSSRPGVMSSVGQAIIDDARTTLDHIEASRLDPYTVAVGRETVDLVVEHLRRLGNLPDDAQFRSSDRSLSLSLAASLGDLIGVDVPIDGDPEPAPVKVRHCAGCGQPINAGRRWCSEACWDEAYDHRDEERVA